MKAMDLRDKSVDELTAMLNEAEVSLFKIMNGLKLSRKLEKPHLIRETRKLIARLYTIINEKNAVEA